MFSFYRLFFFFPRTTQTSTWSWNMCPAERCSPISDALGGSGVVHIVFILYIVLFRPHSALSDAIGFSFTVNTMQDFMQLR